MNFLTENIQLVVASIALLALLFFAVIVWRALSPRISGRRGQRLGVSEYYEIDKSRRLVLVRRDNVEHLIIIGGGQDLVIEPNITASAIAAAYTPTPVTPDTSGYRPSPRAPAFSDRRTAGRQGEAQPVRREEPEL
jgi:hypothetical protein